ncbi:hypothetical protein [uncultured Marivita sp.]|nr:hypothetical protein [uncultured Marivita sp.]
MSDVELLQMQRSIGGQLGPLSPLNQIKDIRAKAPTAKLREKTDAR